MHARDTKLFADLAIPAAILVAAGAVGLGGIFAGWPHCGATLCAFGFGGALAMRLRLVETKPPQLKAPLWRGFLIAVAGFTWAFIGWQTWLWLHTPTQGYTRAQLDNAVNKAVEDATAPLRSQITQLQTAPNMSQQPTQQQETRIKVDVTPLYLMGLYEGRMSSEGDRLLKPYIGKWINLKIAVKDVLGQVVSSFITDKNGRFKSIALFFDDAANEKLSVLVRDQEITVLCQIKDGGETHMRFDHCEFADK